MQPVHLDKPTSDPIDRIIITPQQLADRVAILGRKISARHRDLDEPLVVITVLNGALVFLADLIRQMPISITVGIIGVSGYPGAARRSQGAKIKMQLDVEADLKGRQVLIVDDILDSGNTLRLVRSMIAEKQPGGLETAVLLRKPSNAPPDVNVDYIGFDIADEFVVGYGLDYDGRYRNLPHIAVLKPEPSREASAIGIGQVDRAKS